MMTLNMLVGSGGVLSHAPRRQQAALMMLDAFQPEGITRLAVDSIFMMPQLGVLSVVHKNAATEVFEKDCLIHLGTCIAPVGEFKGRSKPIMEYRIEMPDGSIEEGELKPGSIKLIKLGFSEETGMPLKAKAVLHPEHGQDVGAGKGQKLGTTVSGGVVGIIIDGRGRPFTPPEENKLRVSKLKEWITELEIYPLEAIDRD